MTRLPTVPRQGRSLPAWTKTFSEAEWINGRRVRGYSFVFASVYALVILVTILLSSHCVDPMGRALGTDFLGVWTAGRTALSGHAPEAYDYDREAAAQKQALPWKDGKAPGLVPWHYPPTALLMAAGLAFLPYGAALGLWMALTLPLYLLSIRWIVPWRRVMIPALAFPAVLSVFTHGQNGFLTAGLLGCALAVLDSRPWTAGILFGLLAYKPQFGLLVPVALLVGRYWRTIAAAALTVLATAAMSFVAFGGETWRAFFAGLRMTRSFDLEQGATGWEKIQSAFAAVRMFGGSIESAYAAQAVFTALAAAAVVWAWHRRCGVEIRSAVLAIAALMATPYVLDYDLIVLALPIAWLTVLGVREGFLPWEKITLAAAWLLPLLSRIAGRSLHLPLAPLILLLLLVATLRRAAFPPKAT